MAKKKTTLKAPPGLNAAEKATLSRILKKARAAKAYYRESNPPLIKVPAKRVRK